MNNFTRCVLNAYIRNNKLAILDSYFDFENGVDPLAMLTLNDTGETFITEKQIFDYLEGAFGKDYIQGVEFRLRSCPLPSALAVNNEVTRGYNDALQLIYELFTRKILKDDIEKFPKPINTIL